MRSRNTSPRSRAPILARIAVRCVTLGIRDRLIAFVGGNEPIDSVLESLSSQSTYSTHHAQAHAAPTSR